MKHIQPRLYINSLLCTDISNRFLQVAATPMPPEYANMRVGILCNDCHAKGEVAFHIVGLKCGDCGGYNTRQVSAPQPVSEEVGAPAEEEQAPAEEDPQEQTEDGD